MDSLKPESRKKLFCLLLGISFVVGVVLRVLSLNDPLWLDELHTAWCVDGWFDDVSDRAIIGNQSPLFFWLNWFSFKTFGPSAFALRLPSLIASIGLLASIPWIVHRLTGSMVGAWLALSLASIDDLFLFYAVEARPYAMVQLVVVWQLFFLSLWIGTPARLRNLTATVSLSILLFYLQYTTALFILVESMLVGIWILIQWRRGHRLPLSGRGMAIFAVGIAICVPGVLSLLSIGEHRGEWTGMSDSNRYALMIIAQTLIYAGLPLLFVCVSRKRQLGRDNETTTWVKNNWHFMFFLCVSVCLLVPCLAFFLTATEIAPLAHYRFTIAGSTTVILVTGILFGRIHSRRMKAAAAIATFAIAIITNPLFEAVLRTGRWPFQRNEHWPVTLAEIENEPLPIVLCPNLIEDNRQLLLDSMSVRNRRMQTYYAFPLLGIEAVNGPSKRPYYSSSIGRSLFGCRIIGASISNNVVQPDKVAKEALLSFKEANAGWLVVRATHEDAEQIVRNLCNDFNEGSTEPEWRYSRMTEAPINLFRISRIGK